MSESLPDRLAREAFSRAGDCDHSSCNHAAPYYDCEREKIADAIRAALDEAAKVARGVLIRCRLCDRSLLHLGPCEGDTTLRDAIAAAIEALKLPPANNSLAQ